MIGGSEALALGALEAGVQFVTGYPGSPSTETVESLLRLAPRGVRIEWAINEKSAFDAAFGASLAGLRTLVCLKSVGLNVALDSLMVSNLAGGDGSFVILAGDDPGGWSSQNEEDSRPLAVAAEVPLLEPCSLAEARPTMVGAFALSERYQVPVVVRVVSALAAESGESPAAPLPAAEARPGAFRRQGDRFNVLPIHVVEYHRRLQATLRQVQLEFEGLAQSGEEGQGRCGVVVAGFAYQKLRRVLGAAAGADLRLLRLATLFPLPQRRLAEFLRRVEGALVLEETAPYLETQLQAIAQRAGLTLPILGRSTGHVPGAGELSASHIARAVQGLLPGWPWPSLPDTERTMPSRTALCEDCPYIPALEALLAVFDRHGGRDAFVVTGETGCMVRAQLPPWQILDVKYAMGSSISLAAGLLRAGIRQRVVALAGDSALLHSGLGELIDAVQAGLPLLVVVLANQTTALSGGQPHPATDHDASGRPRRPVDLAALLRATGCQEVRVVSPTQAQALQQALDSGVTAAEVSVVVVEQPCPRYDGVDILRPGCYNAGRP